MKKSLPTDAHIHTVTETEAETEADDDGVHLVIAYIDVAIVVCVSVMPLKMLLSYWQQMSSTDILYIYTIYKYIYVCFFRDCSLTLYRCKHFINFRFLLFRYDVIRLASVSFDSTGKAWELLLSLHRGQSMILHVL